LCTHSGVFFCSDPPILMTRTVHRAQYVLAESDLLLQNAAVYVSEPGRITRVVPWEGAPDVGCRVVDWGSAVLIPGLINAHTHLELSRLHNQLRSFASFTDWLARLIEARRQWTPEEIRASVREGAEASLRSGTTLVGDIASSAASREMLEAAAIRKVVFEEVLGLSPARAADAMADLRKRLPGSEDPLLKPGISPHAPYTVSPLLFRSAAELAAERSLLLATHTAETKAELLFLESGSGEFRDFLQKFGALPPEWTPPGRKPVAFLESLGLLRQPSLLIHCNYLDLESIAMIRDSNCSVVFCPRSSTFFGHGDHPVRQLLDSGINVALGTDSLASNDSLSMLDEMRFLFRRRLDLKPEEIFRAATLNGAAALGFGGQLGRLSPGYWADMTVLELADNVAGRNLIAHILEGAGECAGTIVQGNIAWSRAQRV
jgi:aminodeoxyfutalosine deaminase